MLFKDKEIHAAYYQATDPRKGLFSTFGFVPENRQYLLPTELHDTLQEQRDRFEADYKVGAMSVK